MSYRQLRKTVQFNRGMAWLISTVFHPIFLFFWLTLTFMVYSPAILHPVMEKDFLSLIIVVLISTAIIPVLVVLGIGVFLYRTFRPGRFFMENKEERVYPFLFIAAYYMALDYVVFRQLSVTLFQIAFIVSFLVALTGLISRYAKISAHAVGMGAGFGILLSIVRLFPAINYLTPVLLCVLVSGLVLCARLYLGAHKPAQIYAGYSLGLAISCGVMLLNFSI